MTLCIGIDVGTSACRACAIDARAAIVAQASNALPAPRRNGACVEQDAETWWQCLQRTLEDLNRRIDPSAVKRIAIDATSGTLLLCRRDGTPLTPGLMYNDSRAADEAATIERLAPPDSAVSGAGSGLAKLLYLSRQVTETGWLGAHQADWLTGRLTGRFGISDENNALKTGYDPFQRAWPGWLEQLRLPPQCLPTVVPGGSPVGTIDPALARRWNWPDNVEVVAGTTDSTAGFIATGASTAVTTACAPKSATVTGDLSFLSIAVSEIRLAWTVRHRPLAFSTASMASLRSSSYGIWRLHGGWFRRSGRERRAGKGSGKRAALQGSASTPTPGVIRRANPTP